MISNISVDLKLAAAVEKELYSPIVPWQYTSRTIEYNKLSSEVFNKINEDYGPIIDTQKITWCAYLDQKTHIKKFEEVQSNPSSPFRQRFPNVLNIVTTLVKMADLDQHRVVRVMTNMQMIRPNWSLNGPHWDYNNDNTTILYYVNDSDGDTHLFQGDRCIYKAEPKQGRAIVFPSRTVHAGSTPVNTETRTVINICLAPINN